MMRVLLLGGTGFVGGAVAKSLRETPGFELVVAARRPVSSDTVSFVRVDATRLASIQKAMSGVDAIVNCVTGSADTIRNSARAIAEAASRAERPVALIHMSSMAVYGSKTGVMLDSSPVSDDVNWYGQAKIDAEAVLRDAFNGVDNRLLVNLRIGCVFGAGSALWVDRIGKLIRSGRLGDLAEYGDGWSNLVHVDDIAAAVILLLQKMKRGIQTYNLAAPDSPRWNDYFRDFAIAIGRVPLKYRTRIALLAETRLFAPPLKALEWLVSGRTNLAVPQSIPPSLLALWRQQIRLDSTRITQDLGLKFTAYEDGLRDSIAYFQSRHGH